jgi:thiazolinyl imide reductase
MRVVVCGTTFGQFYLAAFGRSEFPFDLVGILARGSSRSRTCAERHGVPLFTDPAQLPADVDIACVVVRSGVVGGPGTELAKALMRRGIHVLQEHPVHHDELLECLSHAHRHGVVYHLNAFYSHLEPVRRFTTAARRLFMHERPRFIDAACAIQVAYPLFDILAGALGGLRPWWLGESKLPSDELRDICESDIPFRSIDGAIAGIPLTLRVQNQIDPEDPDNHLHLLHRITFGTLSGNLMLVNTHGPVLWNPRFHVAPSLRESITSHDAAEGPLALPSAMPLGSVEAPSFREIVLSLWPDAVRRALSQLRAAIDNGEQSRHHAQAHLAVARLWQDATVHLGYPDLVSGREPQSESATKVVTTAAAERDRPVSPSSLKAALV